MLVAGHILVTTTFSQAIECPFKAVHTTIAHNLCTSLQTSFDPLNGHKYIVPGHSKFDQDTKIHPTHNDPLPL